MDLSKLFSNMSVMRTRYAIRLVGRVIVLVIGVLMCIYDPGQFDVLQGDNFFRLMMGNRCCTTCRIFNWDHLMMFSPLLFFPSVYCWSLLALAIASWLVWEIFIFLHPERFWEGANAALTCASCTDKLCTQYCRKLRPQGHMTTEVFP